MTGLLTPGERSGHWQASGDLHRRVRSLEANASDSAKRIWVQWAGTVPTVAPTTWTTWTIGLDPENGSALDFDLTQVFMRVETPASSAIQVRVEKSAGGNAAFVASPIDTLTLAPGDYEQTDVISDTISSGDLIRIVFTAVPGVAGIPFYLRVSGKEA